MDYSKFECNNYDEIDIDETFNIWKLKELNLNENILYFGLDQIFFSVLLYIFTMLIFIFISKINKLNYQTIFAIFLYHTIFCIIFYYYTFFYLSDSSTYYLYNLYDFNCNFVEEKFGYSNTMYFVNLLVKSGLNYFNIFIFFNLIGSIGILFTFLTLKKINSLNQNKINFIIYLLIFLPSLHFWSSGIGKDTIVFCLLSIIFYLFINKNHFFYILFFSFIIFLFRPYLSYLIIFSYLLHSLINREVSLTTKLFSISLFSLILIIFNKHILNFLHFEKDFNFQNIIEYINLRRNFFNNEISNLNISTLFFNPLTFMFKPINIISESKFVLVNSFENIILLCTFIFVVLKINIKNIFEVMKKEYYFLYFYFVLTLFPIAISTVNYGQIVRLKLMLLGVFFIILTLIFENCDKGKKSK